MGWVVKATPWPLYLRERPATHCIIIIIIIIIIIQLKCKRDATNVEPEMYDYTTKNWSHWNSNEKLKENLEVVPRRHSIDSLQKTAILGTSHIIRKVLQCEA